MDPMKVPVQALVISRLDLCNSLLAGFLQSIFFFFSLVFWFLSCDKCTYFKLLLTKVSVK